MTSAQNIQMASKLINEHWNIQNPKDDRKTNFIYKANSIDDVLKKSKENNVDINYALHRYVNFKASTACEKLFVKYGATAEKDKKNVQTDFWIDGVPFDLKLTVFPKRLLGKNVTEKQLIRWFYKHQSHTYRREFQNRIFIVCVADTPTKAMKMKCDLKAIEKEIQRFMKDVRLPNEMTVYDDNENKRRVRAAVIFIK